MSQAGETQVIGSRYEVLDAVGLGAAALVYKVRDRVDGTTKALKLLRPESVASTDIVRRFEEEFRVLRGLHHPSLLEVFDYGWTDDDSRYMVMEFVEGQRLDHYLADHPEDLWVILYELCEVLTFIHSHNLLHLDIKPANILVKRTAAFGDEMPLVVLIDFGLTHRRGEGETVGMVGTPEYMAPDVIRGETPYTNAVDYYSLGVSLYELIAGQLPFRGSARDVFAGHLNQPPRFQREKVEYAELYPHIRGLMSKDKRKRLEAFEDFKRAVIARMTGGIQELEKAYGLARINSLGMIGKDEIWKELMEWVEGVESAGPFITLSGEEGSGTTFLASRLESEMSIRGIVAAQFSHLERAVSEAGGTPTDQSMRVWDSLWDAAQRRGAVVLVDAIETLDDTEKELLTYLKRRREMSISDDATSKLRFFSTSSVPAVGTIRGLGTADEGQVDVAIRPLTSEDRSEVVSVFRGSTVSVSDVEDLEHFLGDVGYSAGAICDALRSALLEGVWNFHEGRWRSHLSDYAPELGSISYYKALLATFDAPAQEVVSAAACHSGPVTVETVSTVVGLAPDETRRSCQRMMELGLVRDTGCDGVAELTFVSEGVRLGLYEAVPISARRRFHSRFRELIESLLTQSADEEVCATWTAQLSDHLEGLGNYREALRLQLRVLRYHAKHRNLPKVRRSVHRGDHLCERWHLTGKQTGVGEARRYLTRTLLRCEFDETNYHRVRDIVESRYSSDSNNLPISFATKYIRSLQASGENSRALEVLERCIARIVYPNSTTVLQIRIEEALVRHQRGELSEAISILNKIVEQIVRLDPYYRARAYLHLALCYNALDDLDRVVELVVTAERYAEEADLWYEIGLICQFRSAVLLERQDIAGAKSAIAVALRLGGKMRMHNVVRGALFHASAIYFYIGDYVRCDRYLGKATRLAERLGDTRRLMTYVIRSAMIQQVLGSYGNARSLLRRGERLLAIVPSAEDELTLWLARWDVATDLNSPDAGEIERRLEMLMENQEQPRIRGYFYLLSGRSREFHNELVLAKKSYMLARGSYHDGEIQDDEARAVTGLARIAIAQGDDDEYRRLVEVLSKLISKHPVPDVVAEAGRARLRRKLKFGGGDDDLLRLTRQCERDRENVNSIPVLLLIDADLFAAWRRLGRGEDARRAFDRFHMNVKRVIANLPDREAANSFLARPDIAMTLREYKNLTEDGGV